MMFLVSLFAIIATALFVMVVVDKQGGESCNTKTAPLTAQAVPEKTAKQAEFEEALKVYLRHRFPQMKSFRVLNPCSAPRSARFVEVEVEMPDYTFRKDFETMLIW